jgi:hypothetical protein
LGFPTCGFWGEKDKRAGNGPGMDSNAPGPSEDAPNRGPAIDPQHFEHFVGFPLRILNILNYFFLSQFQWILMLFKKKPTAVGFPETLA